jgi:hypothetical protein
MKLLNSESDPMYLRGDYTLEIALQRQAFIAYTGTSYAHALIMRKKGDTELIYISFGLEGVHLCLCTSDGDSDWYALQTAPEAAKYFLLFGENE